MDSRRLRLSTVCTALLLVSIPQQVTPLLDGGDFVIQDTDSLESQSSKHETHEVCLNPRHWDNFWTFIRKVDDIKSDSVQNLDEADRKCMIIFLFDAITKYALKDLKIQFSLVRIQ